MEEGKAGKGCCAAELGLPPPKAERRPCASCLAAEPKKIMAGEGGCSRTNGVAWVAQGGQLHVQVKREPAHLHLSELVAVKLEQASPTLLPKHDAPPPTHAHHAHHPQHPGAPPSLNNGSIPVGIAVARQRVGEAGLLAALSHQKDAHRMHELGGAAVCAHGAEGGVAVGVAGVVCEERAPLAWPPPPQPPPPLWQYPAQVSMESMMVGGVGGGVSTVGGYQLVREPASGALLLLPAPAELPHAVVWGGVPFPPQPLLLPPPPHAPHHLQLLGGELLASTATLQHTHTHSTRLVTLAPAPHPPQPPHPPPPHALDKRKPLVQPMLAPHALIKIEPEPAHEKPPPPPFAPEPLQPPILTHLYYQPEFPEQGCRSQATSPAAPPTPPPDAPPAPAHRDASNQTDHVDDDDDAPNHADDDERHVACVGVAHSPQEAPPPDDPEPCPDGAPEKALERDAAADAPLSGGAGELLMDAACVPAAATTSVVDVSGLELLSNSIEQFERTTPSTVMPNVDPTPLTIDTRPTTKLSIMIKTSPKSPPRSDAEPQCRFEFPAAEAGGAERAKPSLDGLDILCALAEQRFMEEVVESPSAAVAPVARPYIKTEPLLSPVETERPTEVIKKDRHRHRDDSSSERRRKRSHDREERLRHKLEKMRRHKRDKGRDEERDGGELEASLRRVTACACGAARCAHGVPSAQALVDAMEEDMRARLRDLQRQCDEKRAQLQALTPPPLAPLSPLPALAAPALSPDSDRGSSKKRKVGRPRKVSSPDSTETIVAKKPKSKSSLVGYLLAKGKLKGGILCTRGEPVREDVSRTSKVRPKLKAEPILKSYSEEEETEGGLNRSASSSMESLNEVRQKNREKVDRLVRKHSRDDLPELELAIRRASASSDSDKERRRAKKRRKSLKSKEAAAAGAPAEAPPPRASQCTLTEDKLDSSPRVLTAMGGLFYAGKLSAVQAPDVYAITLDGERGNKPHILSREETLRDAILEVSPRSAAQLAAGTRVCAYWSQQYRCLYPGTVAPPSPAPADAAAPRFVPVEFDDGDSGRIAIDDIRLLEPDYPVVEYENSLFTLGKRRRNTSGTEERRSAVAASGVEEGEGTAGGEGAAEGGDGHRERKKLKKHRKEKLKRLLSSEEDPAALEYVRKKKKKHKCCEEHCKHRKHHKKHHRKHKRRRRSRDSRSADSSDAAPLAAADPVRAVFRKALVKDAVLALAAPPPPDPLEDGGSGLPPPLASPPVAELPKKKTKKRTVSSTSTESGAGGGGGGASKMAAFLPGGALWRWLGAPYRRTARPRHRKLFYRGVQRGEETLRVGEAAVFLSTGRADRPYIGRIVALWEARGLMAVRVEWFYHPEEAEGARALPEPGGLFASPHTDENDVQTISHRCEVLPLPQYRARLAADPERDAADLYYLAGRYDPARRALSLAPGVALAPPSPSTPDP